MSSDYFFYILIPFCIGFVVILFGIYLAVKSNETKRWDETKGIILKSEIDKTSAPSGMDGTSQSYTALIEYKYKVDNQEYISKRIFYGDTIGKPLPFKSKSLIKLYSKDSEVIVYYNPLKPKESVLQKGLHLIVIELFILGSFFILLGVAILRYETAIKSFFVN